MGVLLHSTAEATFPTKNVSNPLEGFPADKSFVHPKMPDLSSTSRSWKCCRLFFSSSTVYPSECTGRGFFSKNHFKQNWRTKCSLVSPPPVKNFTTLVASEKSKKNFWLHSLVVLAKEHWLFLPSKLNTHLLEQSTAEQANRPQSDSCVNKACCSVWKLCHLHKVCLREEH